jgi:PAS domain S-box-containing protein
VAGVANKEADYDESDVRALMSMMNDTWRLIRYEEAEQTLREREDKYRAIFEQAADSIVLIDAESGDLVEFNDRAHDILGYTREEFRTLKIPDFEIIESAEQVSKHIKNIVAKGADNFETKHKAKNGKVHNILVSSRAISIGDKDFIMSIWRDFTERKQAEEALKRSEERYALAQRAANIGSWDWDITTDKLVWSDQIEPMFGFGRGEFGATYEAFLECVHPDDRKHVVDSVDACVQEGKDYAIEHRIVWPDGAIRWLSETGDVIRDEGGKAIRMLGIVQDITHHKLAIEQIENLAKFPSEDPSPVLRIAKNGVVLYANSASDSLLAEWGCKVGQTALKNWCRIVSDVFASGSARSIEVAHADSIFAFMIVPVVEADYVNLYGRDITDTKKAQEVLRASEEQFRRAVLDSPLPIMIHAEDGEVLQISKVWTDLTGYTPEEIPTLSAWTEQAYGDRKDIVKSQIDKIFDYDTKVEEGEYVISSKDGETLIWDFSSAPLGKLPDGRRLVISMATDITERKEIASRQELAGRVLELLNQKSTSPDLIHDVIKLIKESTGFEAVGVRLHEGEDFPYFGAKGFPKDFIEDENYLCARNEKGEQVLDEEGHPVLSCMCGSVIIGHADPDLPFFTEGGSFWTNSTTELQSSASLDTLQVPLRNRCNEAGYESVALIPLRSGYEIVGLLQLNDSRPGRFTPEMVRSFERIGASIGIALARIKAEENIHNLAKFPSENPSPVLRIAKEGTVLYANAAGSEFLKTWGCNIGEQVPEHWHKYVLRILKSGLNEELEASCGDRNFSLIIAPVVEAGYVNTYGVDITERKLAEEDLRQYRQHLEELVETRTGELTQANRQLLQEIEARKGLEKEILNVSEQERRKIGQELHDSLGQQLTGVAFMTKVLEQKLSKKSQQRDFTP